MGDTHSPLVNVVFDSAPKLNTFVISDLSKIKAFNVTHRLFLQSFDYSVERLDLSVRRYFPPYRILSASDCSKSGLAHVGGKLSTDDFEIVAICLAFERDFYYIYSDDEDRTPASKVLPKTQLKSLTELVDEASL